MAALPTLPRRPELLAARNSWPSREAEAKHPVEIVGKKLRAAMPFLDPVTWRSGEEP